MALQLGNGFPLRHRRTVGAVLGHRIVGIDNRQNPRRQGNFRAFETLGITVAIPAFMVTENIFRDLAQFRHGLSDPITDLGMFFDFGPFGLSQRGIFFKQLAVDADFADIVEGGHQFQRHQLLLIQPQHPAQLLGQIGHPLSMCFGFVAFFKQRGFNRRHHRGMKTLIFQQFFPVH